MLHFPLRMGNGQFNYDANLVNLQPYFIIQKKYSKLNGVFLIYIFNFTQVKVLFGQILTFYLNYFKILATLSKWQKIGFIKNSTMTKKKNFSIKKKVFVWKQFTGIPKLKDR